MFGKDVSAVKQESGVRNQLRAVRTRLGLSQQEVAQTAGITRQTIGGIEGGLYAPSAAVALKLARALGCRVEDLFWLDEDAATLRAAAVTELPLGRDTRVTLAQVGGRWLAFPLYGEDAVRTEMIPCDGLARSTAAGDPVEVRLLDDPESLGRTVVLAGCTPAMSLWARASERWHPGLRVHWTFANSMEALRLLERREVHIAGLHLCGARNEEFNTPYVRQVMGSRAVTLVNLGTWDEGLLLGPGNPLQIHGGADLGRPGVRLVNREEGAGSRLLLEQVLRNTGIAAGEVAGFGRIARGHWEVAREVAAGAADVGVSTAAVAQAYGLEFLPLREVRYDLAVPTEYLDHEPVRQLLSTLDHRWIRSQLSVLGGYDLRRTGEIVAALS